MGLEEDACDKKDNPKQNAPIIMERVVEKTLLESYHLHECWQVDEVKITLAFIVNKSVNRNKAKTEPNLQIRVSELKSQVPP